MILDNLLYKWQSEADTSINISSGIGSPFKDQENFLYILFGNADTGIRYFYYNIFTIAIPVTIEDDTSIFFVIFDCIHYCVIDTLSKKVWLP